MSTEKSLGIGCYLLCNDLKHPDTGGKGVDSEDKVIGLLREEVY